MGFGDKRLILDTNALSAAAEEHPGVTRVLAAAQQLALPVVVIGEYRFGIAQSRYRVRYRRWLDGLVADSRVLDVDEQTISQIMALLPDSETGILLGLWFGCRSGMQRQPKRVPIRCHKTSFHLRQASA